MQNQTTTQTTQQPQPQPAPAPTTTHTRIIGILEHMAQVLLILAPAAAAPFVHNGQTQQIITDEASLALGSLQVLEASHG